MRRARSGHRDGSAGEEEIDQPEDVRDVDEAVAVGVALRAELEAAAGGGDRAARVCGADRPDAHELGALLRPGSAAPRVAPRRPGKRFVGLAADERRVSVEGEADRGALIRGADRSGADELGALLRPNASAPG